LLPSTGKVREFHVVWKVVTLDAFSAFALLFGDRKGIQPEKLLF